MGGTSFDVAVLMHNQYAVTQRVYFREFLTGIAKIEVISVGAGGGSIGWIDARGVPQVGPRSAGAIPGPACYGRGGTEPTTTDAAVVLGIIDPDDLPRRPPRPLTARSRREAIRSRLAEPLGGTVEEAAAAMHRLTVAEMSDAVRRETVERGRDPREFAFVAYGGALGMFAADICRERITDAIMPLSSSVFSAFGLLGTDDVRVVARRRSWTGGDDVSAVAGGHREPGGRGRDQPARERL